MSKLWKMLGSSQKYATPSRHDVSPAPVYNNFPSDPCNSIRVLATREPRRRTSACRPSYPLVRYHPACPTTTSLICITGAMSV